MIVPFSVPVRPDYATAEMAARRLAREELVETVPYLVEPGHRFRPCLYCGEPRWPAAARSARCSCSTGRTTTTRCSRSPWTAWSRPAPRTTGSDGLEWYWSL